MEATDAAIALAAKETRSGCTVHFVDDRGYDKGPIILQKEVSVNAASDTVEDLRNRVQAEEKKALIEAIISLRDGGVKLDWAMFACSLTPYAHDEFALALLRKLGSKGVTVINSAVFNAGFLIGGDNFDYRKLTPKSDPDKFAWRDKFNALCKEFGVKPAA